MFTSKPEIINIDGINTYIIKNIFNLPKKLYALQLLENEKYSQLVSCDDLSGIIDDVLQLIKANRGWSTPIFRYNIYEAAKAMEKGLLPAGFLEIDERNLEASHEILKRTKK